MSDKLNAWTRRGDFYSAFRREWDLHAPYSGRYYESKAIAVRFSYSSLTVTPIRSITLELRNENMPANRMYLIMQVSPFNIDGLFLSASKLFNNVRRNNADSSINKFYGYQKEGYGTSVRIEIDNNDFLNKFIILLNQNQAIKAKISADIISEIKNFLIFRWGNQDASIQHRIPLDNAVRNDVTSSSDDSKQLIEFIDGFNDENGCPRPQQIKKLHGILSKGENPNKCKEGITTPRLVITYAHRFESYLIEVCKLLLMYGAQPEQPSPVDSVSAVEFAYAMENFQILDFFIAAATKPAHSPTPAKAYLNDKKLKHEVALSAQRYPTHPKIELKTAIDNPEHNTTPAPSISTTNNLVFASFNADKRKIVSSFRFNTGELYTTLKPAANLTEEELTALYQLYSSCFEGEPSQATFGPQKDKYIDVIRHQNGKIVGAIIYHLRWDNDKLWVNNDLELFDSTYPNYGIMPILTYRFPFALQLLYPDLAVWIIGFSAHFNTFRRFQGQLVVPMYRPARKVTEIASVLKDKFNYNFTLTDDSESVCYIKENQPAIVQGACQSKTPSLMEELYQRLRGNIGNIPEAEIKARNVLVGILVSYEFLIALQHIAANKSVNFYSVVFNTAKQIFPSQLIPDAPRDLTLRFFKASPLFWQNIRVIAEEFNHQKMLAMLRQAEDTKARL